MGELITDIGSRVLSAHNPMRALAGFFEARQRALKRGHEQKITGTSRHGENLR